MENKAINVIKKYNMITPGDTIVIGLSGGADSCALLHFLSTIRDEYDITLVACHVNHMLRGDEADRDENFVKDLCRKYDVRLFCKHADIAAMSKELHESTETVGRNVRYSFFEEIADGFGAKVATAHTASDQAETVLLNLTRGSGVKGLCGIPAVRGRIIRPLIESTREEIEDYCKDNNITFVTDSTNLENIYTRNRIRHDVIPALQQINPSFESSVIRMSEIMKNTQSYLQESAEKARENAAVKGGYDCVKLIALHKAVFSEFVFLLCSEYGVIPESKHIEMMYEILDKGGSVQIKENIYAICKQGIFRIACLKESTDFSAPFSVDTEINVPGRTIFVKKLFECKDYDAFSLINGDTVPESAVFRFRESGDKFRLPKRNVTKSLKKLFNEYKIPDEQRNNLILLADGSNILWIEGIGANEYCNLSENTNNIISITID